MKKTTKRIDMKGADSVKHKNLEEALLSFRQKMTGALIKEAKGRGCTLSHFEVLKFVAEEGSPSMKDIAAQLLITPPSASALVDALVGKELVARVQTLEDRRTVRITLTPKAQTLLFSIHKQKSSIFNKMLSKLSMEDKNDLARILIKCG